jgi:hypothetical protein
MVASTGGTPYTSTVGNMPPHSSIVERPSLSKVLGLVFNKIYKKVSIPSYILYQYITPIVSI